MKKKILFAMISLALIVGCVFGATVFAGAEQEVAFVDQTNGNDSNDGKTAATAVKSLQTAYKKLGDTGGTIVLSKDYIINAHYEAPKHSGKVTITSKYNGVDYKTVLWNQASLLLRFNGSTVIENITIKQSYAMTIVANFNPIVIGEGVVVKTSSGSPNTNLSLVGGFYEPTQAQTQITSLNPNITINSGEFNYVCSYTRNKGYATTYYTGAATVTVNGGKIKTVYGASIANHASGSFELNVNGGTIDKVYTGGDVTRRLDGTATVNLYGGTVKDVEFNNVVGNAYLNVMGTAPGKVSITYHPNSTTIKEMADKAGSQRFVNYNSLICYEALIAQFRQHFDVVDNTTCVYVGNKNGDGTSPDNPTNSFKKAYEMLKVDGGTIIVDGEVKCDLAQSTQTFGGKITVQGKNSSAALKFASGHNLTLGTDTTFNSIKLISADDATIIAQDKVLVVNDNVMTQGFFYVRGAYGSDKILEGDVSITLNGGSFKNVVGVDKNSLGFVGNVNILLGGAIVDDVTISDNESTNTKITKASLTVSAGEVKDIVTCDKGKVTDSLVVKVLGGKVENLKLKGAEKSIILNIANAEIKNPVTAENIGTDKSLHTLILGSDVSDSVIANIKSQFGESKNGNMVYVADDAKGTGLSPDSPISDLNAAIKLLGGEGTVVICGKYTIGAALTLDEYAYPVTITSVGTDLDYRANGAVIVLEANIFLGGETLIENVNFEAPKASVYIYANAHKLTIGSAVETELTNANTTYIGLCGGRTDPKINKVIDLTVNSGDWSIVRVGSANTGLYENGVSITFTVNGGTFHKYVALASRGNVNGTINFTANGGKFLQSIYVVYEEDGKNYTAKYDATLTLNGGEFHQEIAPARSAKTRVNGMYTVNVNGGNFGHLTDLKGTETFSGGMKSVINIGAGVDIDKEEEGTVTFQNPVRGSGPDPWVFYHDGYYYYTHTTGKRIVLMKVANYADITTAAETVIIDPTEGQNMWSPEIHYFSEAEVGAENSGWYLYIGYDDGTTANQRQHVLKCLDGDNLMGRWGDPVTGEVNKPRKVEVPNAPHYNNDELCGGSSKIVINGKTYMTFISEVGRGTSNFYQTVNITEIENPWTYKSVPTTICVPEYSWEMGGYGQDKNTGGWYPKVVEGASAVYSDNGDVYLMYTGSGYWTIYYQLGYLKFLGGDPMDAKNWKKNPTSILSLSDEVNGCGHGSYFRDHNGDYYVAYHGYLGKDTSSGRYAHIERIYVTSDGIKIGNGSGHPAPLSTVYTVTVNPLPLAKKISGFTAEKEDDKFFPSFDELTGDTSTVSPSDDKGVLSTTVVVIIIVAVVVVAAVVVTFVFLKKPAKKAEEAKDTDKNSDGGNE